LGYYEDLVVSDELPLNILQNKKLSVWLNDFIAPFLNRIHAYYSMKFESADNVFDPTSIALSSEINVSVFGKSRHESSGRINLEENRINSFSYTNKNIKIEAKWLNI